MDNLLAFYRYLVCQIFYHLLFFITSSQQMTNSGSGSGLTEGSSYFFYQHAEYPRDCQEVLNQCSAANTVTSGVYLIKPDGYSEPFEVFCDNSIESGGWTVIQRRVDGSTDFNRNWVEYKRGFGFLSSEFWLGNAKVSFLTNQKIYELQIAIVNAAGSSFFIHYDLFRISDDRGDFKFAGLGEYSGNSSSVTAYCPTNMEYHNCSCQASCSDHSGCEKNCIDGEETCICPNGFFLDQDSNCVPGQECTCYVEGFGELKNGGTQLTVTSECIGKCSCTDNQLNCTRYQCRDNPICQEIGAEHPCQCNVTFEGDGVICIRQTQVPCRTMTTPTIDCSDLFFAGNSIDGVYNITVDGSEFEVYCDMTTGGGGWTVFQRREDGSEMFYRDWDTYKAGFGALTGEHWLGNDKLHTLTCSEDYQLRVDLVDSGGSWYYALYGNFRVSAESDNYLMTRGWYSGNAGNSLYFASQFSTYDRDNDLSSTYNCAEKHRGGWWYGDSYYYSFGYCWYWPADGRNYGLCTGSNLNGDYFGGDGENIFWTGLPRDDCNIPRTEMKIRRV